jgi:hypothetical protein
MSRHGCQPTNGASVGCRRILPSLLEVRPSPRPLHRHSAHDADRCVCGNGFTGRSGSQVEGRETRPLRRRESTHDPRVPGVHPADASGGADAASRRDSSRPCTAAGAGPRPRRLRHRARSRSPERWHVSRTGPACVPVRSSAGARIRRSNDVAARDRPHRDTFACGSRAAFVAFSRQTARAGSWHPPCIPSRAGPWSSCSSAIERVLIRNPPSLNCRDGAPVGCAPDAAGRTHLVHGGTRIVSRGAPRRRAGVDRAMRRAAGVTPAGTSSLRRQFFQCRGDLRRRSALEGAQADRRARISGALLSRLCGEEVVLR